jgi:hypothetical protein
MKVAEILKLIRYDGWFQVAQGEAIANLNTQVSQEG